MQIRILSAADVRRALPMAAAIAGMKDAFAQLSAGTAHVPLRLRVSVPDPPGVSLVMPAYMQGSGDLAVKVVSVFNANPARGLPLIYGVVLALDPATGQPLALLEGGSLTAIRTGAGAGAATDLLALPECHTAAIIGSGVQARTQLEAICTVRKIHSVRVYSPNAQHAAAFAEAMRAQGPIPQDVQAVASAAAAVRGADIICAATTALTPVFSGHDLKPGAHVNGVGSFTPQMQEIDLETLQRALVIVDSRASAWEEAGDLIQPLRAGSITTDIIHAELGELLCGVKAGRTTGDQITFFKGCGSAAQDAVAARIVVNNATLHNLGTLVEL